MQHCMSTVSFNVYSIFFITILRLINFWFIKIERYKINSLFYFILDWNVYCFTISVLFLSRCLLDFTLCIISSLVLSIHLFLFNKNFPVNFSLSSGKSSKNLEWCTDTYSSVKLFLKPFLIKTPSPSYFLTDIIEMGANAVGMSILPPTITESEARECSSRKLISKTKNNEE